jgi:hypothetical protein
MPKNSLIGLFFSYLFVYLFKTGPEQQRIQPYLQPSALPQLISKLTITTLFRNIFCIV